MPKYPRTTPPYKVFFTWEVTYECNYKCSYCHAPKPNNPNTRKTLYPGTEQWLKIWDKIYDDYGETEIVISGGEPFIYPNFVELMIDISKKHIIEFCTKPFILRLLKKHRG
jgi:MoaA/NifB/PqqE/SkfB family radical SAM enzyme